MELAKHYAIRCSTEEQARECRDDALANIFNTTENRDDLYMGIIGYLVDVGFLQDGEPQQNEVQEVDLSTDCKNDKHGIYDGKCFACGKVFEGYPENPIYEVQESPSTLSQDICDGLDKQYRGDKREHFRLSIEDKFEISFDYKGFLADVLVQKINQDIVNESPSEDNLVEKQIESIMKDCSGNYMVDENGYERYNFSDEGLRYILQKHLSK